MSDIEIAVKNSKILEQLLESKFGAVGKGLHQKVDSVTHRLDGATVKRLRWIATLRNKVVHEDFAVENVAEYVAACEQCRAVLEKGPTVRIARSGTPTSRPSNHLRLTRPVIFAAAAGAAAIAIYMTGATKPAQQQAKTAPPLVSQAATPPRSALQPTVPAAVAPVTIPPTVLRRLNALSEAENLGHFTLLPNGALRISDATIRRYKGEMGFGKHLYVSGYAKNISRHTIMLASAITSIGLPDGRSINGIKNTLYFSNSGLAPGATTHINIQLDSLFNEFKVDVPDVINAKKLNINMRIRNFDDGMGNTVNVQ